MMLQLRRQFISLGLAAVFLTATITGCAAGTDQGGTVSKDQPASSAENQASQETTVETVAASEENAQEGENITYPLTDAPELSIWSAPLVPEQSYTDYTQSPFHMGLAEKTGVNVKWEFPTQGTDANQAYNLMLTSEQLPDMIYWTYPSNGQAESLMDEGLIRDLTELLPKYAPNYWKYIHENEHYNKGAMTDNGKYYGICAFREDPWQATYAGPVVRKDWLDELGMEIPTNIEEWDAVLRAFHERYGATFSALNARLNPGLASGFNAFSTYGIGFYIDSNGKVQCAQEQPEWEALISQFHEWYKDGLIDPDFTTIDDAGVRTKALNDEIGVSVTSIAQMSNWIADAEAENTGSEWVGAPYPVYKDGEKIHAIQAEDTIQDYAVAITTSCPEEKIETALRWLDYGFTEEGFLYWNFGTEGETYEMVDGKPIYTSLITEDPKGMSAALDKYTGMQWTGIGVQATALVQAKNAPASIAAVDLWTSNTDYLDYFYPRGTSMTVEENNEYSMLYNSIDTYAREMQLKFVVGDEPLENMNDFMKQLKEMGLDRLIEIKQATYDRYLAR